jgi:hypothetical protein
VGERGESAWTPMIVLAEALAVVLPVFAVVAALSFLAYALAE